MSWAAHDPEGWNQVCINAIIDQMRNRNIIRRFQGSEEKARLKLDELLNEEGGSEVFEALLDWASDCIGEAESAYLCRDTH